MMSISYPRSALVNASLDLGEGRVKSECTVLKGKHSQCCKGIKSRSYSALMPAFTIKPSNDAQSKSKHVML